MTETRAPRRHDTAARPLVGVGGVLLVGGTAVVLGALVSGAFARPPLGGTAAAVVVAAVAAASFGAGSLLVALLARR